MAQERVTIKIKNDGSGLVSFDLNGFQGEGCNIIKDIEAAMGTITENKETDEMHLSRNPDPAFNELAL